MTSYESTVTPEIAPCDLCMVLTDEHDAEPFDGHEWVCSDCRAAEHDHTGEDG